jgi:integrase
LVKYPVKAFGMPQLALAYAKSLRPDERGKVYAAAQGETTVSELYAYISKNLWTSIGPKRQELKDSRWRLHLAPYWGSWAISEVTKRAAQEWVGETEAAIAAGKAGKLGLPQFNECRLDMHGMFEALDSFDERFADKKNPFAGLAFKARETRAHICIESGHFAAVEYACRSLVEAGLATDWVTAQFLTSLFGGLRLGEVMALCRDQLDFANGIIRVDRAMREKDREILDPRKKDAKGRMIPAGEVKRMAINLPKGDKIRLVPMSDQLAAILRPFYDQPKVAGAKWDLLFPSAKGDLREETRQAHGFGTLCKRLDEIAKQECKGGRGWPANPVLDEFEEGALPDIWDVIVFRDTRNSFATYAEEVGIPQATREAILGHGAKGVTNRFYTDITSKLLQDARSLLSNGWQCR